MFNLTKKSDRACCPSCGTNSRVYPNQWPDHPAQKFLTFDSHYYVLMCQYHCGHCEGANKDPEKAEKVEYLFQGYQAESMKLFKHHIQESYPAVLTHRNAVDKVLVDMLRPVTDKGLSFNALQEILTLVVIHERLHHASGQIASH
jgi:hypothetical protein